MRVKSEDEERIRQAGKLINEKIKSYKERFGLEDFQDLLAMVAFDCQVDKMKGEEGKHHTDKSSIEQLKYLNGLIAEAL